MQLPRVDEEIAVDLSRFVRDGDFEEGQDKNTRLMGNLSINGTWHHVECIQVETPTDGEDEGCQRAVNEFLRDSFDSYYAAAGGDGAMQTVTFEGREYCIFITPHC